MPYLFTLLCSCFNSRIRTHSPYSVTERKKSAYSSSQQATRFSEKINDLEVSELSTINPPHLNIKNLNSTVTTPPIKQKKKTDFFESEETEANLRYRSFSRICPSAIFNRDIHD